MAKAADFDGKANETEVITPESVKGKRKTSILGKKARLWLINTNEILGVNASPNGARPTLNIAPHISFTFFKDTYT